MYRSVTCRTRASMRGLTPCVVMKAETQISVLVPSPPLSPTSRPSVPEQATLSQTPVRDPHGTSCLNHCLRDMAQDPDSDSGCPTDSWLS